MTLLTESAPGRKQFRRLRSISRHAIRRRTFYSLVSARFPATDRDARPMRQWRWLEIATSPRCMRLLFELYTSTARPSSATPDAAGSDHFRPRRQSEIDNTSTAEVTKPAALHRPGRLRQKSRRHTIPQHPLLPERSASTGSRRRFPLMVVILRQKAVRTALSLTMPATTAQPPKLTGLFCRWTLDADLSLNSQAAGRGCPFHETAYLSGC